MTRLSPAAARGASHTKGPKVSYEQFLRWEGENQHVEWVDGRVVQMPAVTGEHCEVKGFLPSTVGVFVQERRLGTIRSSPFQMKTGPDLPGRAPDLLFVSRRNNGRLKRMYLEGPADLVVEIIDPDSRTIDRVEKFREYEAGGVREYWLIDPERRRAEFYRRGRDGRFKAANVGDDSVFRSAVVKWLWLALAAAAAARCAQAAEVNLTGSRRPHDPLP